MAVHLQHLKKRYVGPDGSVVPVIDIEAFGLRDGEQVALIGSSGSGKTTLLHLMAGILAPDSGRIIYDVGPHAPPVPTAAPNAAAGAPPPGIPPAGGGGAHPVNYQGSNYQGRAGGGPESLGIDIATLGEADRDVFRGRYIGYIFQTHHLLPGFTALENVLLGMSFTGRKQDPAWGRRLLGEVGLSERLHYKPAKLSVGQQQRVAVARALANRPKLVLADEPTGALDERSAQQTLDLIRLLCREVNAALLLVSHDLTIAKQLPRVLNLAELNEAAAGGNRNRTDGGLP